MQIRKMILPVLVMFVVGVTLAFAHGSAESSTAAKPNKPVMLNALFMKQASYSEQNVRDMTAGYEKEHPNVKITPEFVPYVGLHDKIITAAASGSGYDTVLFDVIWPAQFAQQHILRNITKSIPQSMINQVKAGTWASVRYNGQYYGLPWILDTEYLYYNKNMLQKAGISHPPHSLQQMLADGKTLKAKGIVKYPIIWAWDQSEDVALNYDVLVYGFGGSFFNSQHQPTFNTGGGLKALQYMVRSLKDGVSNPASMQTRSGGEVRVFSAGNAAFALNWTYMYSIANSDSSQSSVVGQVGIEPVPGDGTNVKMSAINGSMGLGVTTFSQHPTQALSYIKYLSSFQQENKYAQLNLPMWKSFYKDPSTWPKGMTPLIHAAQTSFSKLYSRPELVHYTEFSKIMQRYLQKALLYQMTPKAALDAAAKEVVASGANK